MYPRCAPHLQHPAQGEVGVHELHQAQQQLQGPHVALEAIPQVQVLHLGGAGSPGWGLAAPSPVPQVRPRPQGHTLTATGVPSGRVARCTWARLAAATGS